MEELHNDEECSNGSIGYKTAIIQSRILEGKVKPLGSKDLQDNVFPSMLQDEISHIAQNDTLICCLGDEYLLQTRRNPVRYKNYTSEHMRRG